MAAFLFNSLNFTWMKSPSLFFIFYVEMESELSGLIGTSTVFVQLKEQAEQLEDRDNRLKEKDEQLRDREEKLTEKEEQLHEKVEELKGTEVIISTRVERTELEALEKKHDKDLRKLKDEMQQLEEDKSTLNKEVWYSALPNPRAISWSCSV